VGKLIVNRSFWMLPLLFWTALVAVSFAWNLADIDSHRQEVLTNRARFIFKMVESVRLWNARHGGLYAEITAATPPNPHLEVDERDIRTPSGRELTLVNPAYMTRQLAGVVDELTDVQIHLTSLKPINPGNAADPWEAAALKRFEVERQKGEWTEFAVDDSGKEHFRFIAPLLTKKACLRCHEKQGYREGDIRGGISVTFPPGTLLTPVTGQLHKLVATHLGVLLLLSALTVLFLGRMRRQIMVLEEAKATQEQLVEQRTRELRHEARQHQQAEARLRGFIESTGQGIFAVDKRGHFTLCNPAAMQLLGYVEETSLLDRNAHELLCSCGEREVQTAQAHCGGCAIFNSYSAGESQHVEAAQFCRADGTPIPVEFRSHPLYGREEIEGAVITFADISDRLQREQQLRKLSKALEYSPVAALITDSEGHIEYVNHRLVKECGYQAEELLGNTPALLKSGHTPAATYEAMWTQLKRGEPWQGELLNRKKSGELFWDETAIAPITDDGGKVINYVAFKENITRKKEEVERVWRQANFDGLTHLPNRNHFLDQLEHHIREAQRYERRFALVFIDLDGFKQVNDTLGHDAGDELLRLSAQRLRENTRSSDLVSRLGGDEFTVIIPEFEHYGDIEQVAQKLIDAILKPHRIKEHEVQVSASIGIALCPEDAEDRDTLINKADTAMYAAKRDGKNRYRFYFDNAFDEEASVDHLTRE
jgi:diguanylate cyclase (GGDEF)-like protein/PAS domain S-box-containing protein